MKNITMTIAEQAFAYHVQGYSVIPCRKDKRPALSSWKKYQTQQPTDDEILAWFPKEAKTPHNIAIITGKISGITVIDIDVKGGQEQADAMYKKFPATYTVQSPSGGYHLYYQYHAGLTVSANAYPQYPNLDIRSDTGYICAPPSITDKGEYKVIDNRQIAPFPADMFPKSKPRKTLTEQTTASKGNRNDTLASFTGLLLQTAKEDVWENEVWPAVLRANKTYSPPLSEQEARTIFESICKKEKSNREGLIVSPMQLDDGNMSSPVRLPLRKNGAGMPHKDMANAYIVLENHPYYKNTIRYNTFRHEIEYNGRPLEDADITKIQFFMQTDVGLSGIPDSVVYSAIVHYAQKNKYDEVQDWLKSLTWDQTPRLASWLHSATGVIDDDYHQGIGTQWFTGMIRRIMHPGCSMDYMLVLVGGQGLGKTSLFRILGGPWYKSYTGSIETKDFYLALRGALIVDLDEGATLYRAEAIRIKSIITETHDEFRAPYDRIMKKYPRRFVFSMSTNDAEPFRDETGNRRYWVIDIDKNVNFKWLEENREQLFAEAYYYFKNKIDIPEVPMDKARSKQEEHMMDDSWADRVEDEVRKSYQYCQGDPDYSTTVIEVFEKIFPDESIARLGKIQEMRIANIFKRKLGLVKIQKMIDGQRRNRWYISELKIAELQKNNVKQVINPIDLFDKTD